MVDIEVGDGFGARAPHDTDDATVLDLRDPRAGNADVVGGKAAALARAAGAGLPVLPGFVVLGPAAGAPHADGDELGLYRAWRELSEAGHRPLVVRSSSAAEDTAESTMAGWFESVLNVRGWEAFQSAVATVRASAHRAPGARGTAATTEPTATTATTRTAEAAEAAAGAPGGAAPMAVLVQPMVRARVGGVLFGADPVAGRTDRFLLSVVRGGPDRLVGGAHQGTSCHLTPHGRLLDGPADAVAALLSGAELRRLAALARRAAHVFGGPQDIEFGFDATGELWLFQSRPVTAMAPRPPRRARLLGPGPVAETLPEVLQPLEEDLWVVPMAHGLATALDVAGAAPRRLLRATPVVTTVEGRAVADLRLLGAAPRRRRLLAALNPLPGLRRLAAAWRVGRLHGTLPELAQALAADVDRELAQAPPPPGMTAETLVAALRWARATLAALHAQEALAGALLPPPEPGRSGGTAAAVALAALHHGRAEGLPDAQLVAARPEVLALVPPSLTRPQALPDHAPPGPGATGGPAQAGGATPDRLGPREALRLRIRWVQEFQVRLVWEVARRVDARRGPGAPGLGERVALLRWPELVAAAGGGPLPADLAGRHPRPAGPPLPDAFRLTEDGLVVAEPPGDATGKRAGDGAGQGVSGGRALGTVWDGTGEPPPEPVLVVRTLDPALAPLLPRLAGLVAQTGSPLSHLAVLARELRLPTVTGAAGAVDRFPPGTRVVVDGSTGEVTTSPVDPPVRPATGVPAPDAAARRDRSLPPAATAAGATPAGRPGSEAAR